MRTIQLCERHSPGWWYRLATSKTAGIREVLVITTPGDASRFERSLGDGAEHVRVIGERQGFKIAASRRSLGSKAAD